MITTQQRVALDALRALAALYVVLHHTVPKFYDGYGSYLFKFGQEAVIIFFLLSGFVIHINEKSRAHNIIAYILRRLLRLYPTFLAALFVSFLVAFSNGVLSDKFSLPELACNLFMLQDREQLVPGTVCSPFLGNTPLWSLSYEFAFYAIYAIFLPLYLKFKKLGQHIVGILTLIFIFSYFVFPSHVFLIPSYFIIWWCGAMIGDFYTRERCFRSTLLVPVLYLGAATLVWIAILLKEGEYISFGHYPVLQVRHFAFALLFCLASFIFPVRNVARWLGTGCAKIWFFLSSVSYGIYVFHYPLLVQWKFSYSLIGFMVACALTLALSYLFDYRANRLIRRHANLN